MSQKWPLSQNAQKSSGECSVCHAVRQLHISDGTVHRHGPRHNPCSGSDKPPVAVRPYVPPTKFEKQVATSASADSHQIDAAASSLTVGTDPSPAAGLTHPTLARRTVKHIPKSARPACAKQYAELLRQCTSDPYNVLAWQDLLNFGRDVLLQPVRGGKRHNLASTIKKRIVEPYNADNEPIIHRAKKRDAATVLAKAVTAKIEDGNLRAAIRIMCSEDKPAPNSDSVYTQLLNSTFLPSRISRRTRRSSTSARLRNGQLQRNKLRTPLSIDRICQLPPERRNSPKCESSAVWRQPDRVGKENRRCPSYCHRLHFTPHRCKVCQQLRC